MSVPAEDPNMHASVNASARAGDPADISEVVRAAADTIERTFMILP